MEQHVDFKDKEKIIKFGIEPAVHFNNEKMMKYYFVEKGLKFTIEADQIIYEQFGGSIADDRGMWQDPQSESVPLQITVKDGSTLKFDSVSKS